MLTTADWLYIGATLVQVYAYLGLGAIRIETVTLSGCAYWLAVLAAFKLGYIR